MAGAAPPEEPPEEPPTLLSAIPRVPTGCGTHGFCLLFALVMVSDPRVTVSKFGIGRVAALGG